MKNIKKNKKKKSIGIKLFICVMTTLNVVASICTRIYDRKQIIKAVQNDDTVKTVLISEKITKSL